MPQVRLVASADALEDESTPHDRRVEWVCRDSRRWRAVGARDAFTSCRGCAPLAVLEGFVALREGSRHQPSCLEHTPGVASGGTAWCDVLRRVACSWLASGARPACEATDAPGEFGDRSGPPRRATSAKSEASPLRGAAARFENTHKDSRRERSNRYSLRASSTWTSSRRPGPQRSTFAAG